VSVATASYSSSDCLSDLSAKVVKTLIQAIISCCRDYCNSLFYGITEGLMSQLQNAAARFVSGAMLRLHHASATGAALVSDSTSVDFKMATLVYLSLSGWFQPI